MSTSIVDLVAWRAERVPALGVFLKDVARRLSGGDPEAFWGCAPAFEALVRSVAARDLLRAELDLAAEDPRYAPPSADALSLVEAHEFGLLLKLVPPAAAGEPLQSLPEHLQVGVLGPGRLAVDVYAEAPGYRNESVARARRLRGEGAISIGAGEIAGFRSGEHVVRFDGPPEGTLCLLFTSAVVQRLRWVYDANTLLAVRAHAGLRAEHAPARRRSRLDHRESPVSAWLV
ncbi:hypothetical protein [Sorangium sp. So ce131]|uniref:hypothetical protein n=1 Tax=Sorangium sp. So ce131 TaxID=3133282 RepID=UPI003F635C48